MAGRGYSRRVMSHTRSQAHPRLKMATRVLAVILASVHALVITFAPLAERADSSVAPVHTEQAGTSTHHAHGELCAICAASHLVAPLPRVALAPLVMRADAQLQGARRQLVAAVERLPAQPRAPPA
jgi:hypothetical protein